MTNKCSVTAAGPRSASRMESEGASVVGIRLGPPTAAPACGTRELELLELENTALRQRAADLLLEIYALRQRIPHTLTGSGCKQRTFPVIHRRTRSRARLDG